eukprot:gene1752-4864_t
MDAAVQSPKGEAGSDDHRTRTYISLFWPKEIDSRGRERRTAWAKIATLRRHIRGVQSGQAGPRAMPNSRQPRSCYMIQRTRRAGISFLPHNF